MTAMDVIMTVLARRPRRNIRLLAKARSRQMVSLTIVKGAPLVYCLIQLCLLTLVYCVIVNAVVVIFITSWHL